MFTNQISYLDILMQTIPPFSDNFRDNPDGLSCLLSYFIYFGRQVFSSSRKY